MLHVYHFNITIAENQVNEQHSLVPRQDEVCYLFSVRLPYA